MLIIDGQHSMRRGKRGKVVSLLSRISFGFVAALLALTGLKVTTKYEGGFFPTQPLRSRGVQVSQRNALPILRTLLVQRFSNTYARKCFIFIWRVSMCDTTKNYGSHVRLSVSQLRQFRRTCISNGQNGDLQLLWDVTFSFRSGG